MKLFKIIGYASGLILISYMASRLIKRPESTEDNDLLYSVDDFLTQL